MNQNLLDESISNVAYYFNFNKDRIEEILRLILQTSQTTEASRWWFIRSLSVNANVSLKPFTEKLTDEDAKKILKYYFSHHQDLGLNHWIPYTDVLRPLKTKSVLIKELRYKPEKGYTVDWLPQSPEKKFWDGLLYPVDEQKGRNQQDLCISIYVNWVMSLDKKEIMDFKNLNSFLLHNCLRFDTLPTIRMFLSLGEDNPEFIRSIMLTTVGIRFFVNNHSVVLKDSATYMERNGYRFIAAQPKMPYGFDYIASLLGISCYSKPVSLWKV
jgi:hypothetical protein